MANISRRKFGQIGLAALASALIPLNYASSPAYASESNGIEYTKIRERTATKLGNETVKIEFGLESKLWQGLKPGMKKQEFYDAIKQSPIELKTETIFGGIFGVRGYINNEDIRDEFLSAADRFIKNKPSEYDTNLRFTKEDKKVLEKMLNRELKSPLTDTAGYSLFGTSRTIYLYPPKSQILLRTDREGCAIFDIQVNSNSDSDTPLSYEKPVVVKIKDEAEKEIFRKFLLLSILTKDPEGIIPFENFYKEYLGRKN